MNLKNCKQCTKKMWILPASGPLRGTAGQGTKEHHYLFLIRRGGVPSGAAAFIVSYGKVDELYYQHVHLRKVIESFVPVIFKLPPKPQIPCAGMATNITLR